ncbi:NAD(P)-binding domain-containing protein [Verrucosispora sp. WMMD1129]|uniref:imine reductase family protein n=1 Tax=Verrucosispora sp. WMMD1129 TaxID=3016093 RepID=UPI002499E8C0|nr:NAD(P)-binding domain-containing protein [Verrucosispora sp. WMMD1129]WFE44777.1 NAD(P)-binding domain-containing protein [Verrucosispora sp. WMMD1129]
MTVSTTFLGLGAMGSALATAALDAGHRVACWNRTGHRAQSLGERGAVIADSYLGPDAGMAALYDTAMLAGMYAMFAGFLHGAAMVGSEGVPAGEFVRRQAPFLAAMTEQLAGFAATIDEQDYLGPGQQSLRFTETALNTVMQASTGQGVTDEVLKPAHDMVRRQLAAGFGEHGTARMFEELRSVR